MGEVAEQLLVERLACASVSRAFVMASPLHGPDLNRRRTKNLVAGDYLFVGSEACSEAAAIAFTLIETTKFNTVNPHFWLADTLARIPDDKFTKVKDLLPWRCDG